MVMTLFTACTNDTTEKDKSNPTTTVTEQATEATTEQTTEAENNYHTLYFKDSSKSNKAVATFFHSVSGKSEDVEMKKVNEDKDTVTFSCEGDCSVYNMAYVTYGEQKTLEFAFNKCTSGWHKIGDELLPYMEGEVDGNFSEYDEVTLTAGEYEKNIHVWKPDNYDASSDEKYSTIYLPDADIFENFVIEQVKAMMALTDNKAIIIAIENNFARNYELLPKIGVSADEKQLGELEYDSMNGSEFAEFIAKTLVPYVQKHYNVYTDARHTSIAGVSMSGLETFYTVMEYPDVFGTLGALSPSFWEYDEATWKKYLSNKKFDMNVPFLYFYTGSEKTDTGAEVTDMYNRLKDMGYPEDKLVLHFNEKGSHKGSYWSCIFSEFLTAATFGCIETLQQ